jgi:hypothetical protein
VSYVALIRRSTLVTTDAKEHAVRLIFLGKETEGGNSPTLFDTDADKFVIQGFNLDAQTLGQVGTVPDGEGVIWIPKDLMKHLPKALLRQLLEEDDAAADG